MDDNIKKEILENLRNYLSELINRHERLKEENLMLFQQNQKLIEANKQKDLEIQKLKEKFETYKLTNAFILTSEGEDLSERKHDAKIKINRLIKEIDSCIALLNQ